jgi:hypothetical protein
MRTIGAFSTELAIFSKRPTGGILHAYIFLLYLQNLKNEGWGQVFEGWGQVFHYYLPPIS